MSAALKQGLTHHRDGRIGEAMRCYARAIEEEPWQVDAYAKLAQASLQLGQLDQAERCWRSIIRLQPDLPGAHNNLGATLRSLGRPVEAIESFRRALAIEPAFASASANLGAALCELSRFEESIPYYLAALQAMPNYPKALCNLGSALRDLRRFEEALECLAHALRIEADFPEAHFNSAQILLLTGRLEAGWAEFEWRRLLPGRATRMFAATAWRGGPTMGPLGPRTLLLHAEEGLGDTIQFCRFIPRLLAEGHRVVLEVQPPLRRLLAQIPGLVQVVAAGETLPQHELECPLLSLPLVQGITEANLPATTPYLHADPAAVSRWQNRLADVAGAAEAAGERVRVVGLAWAGNPDYAADLRRSIALAQLAPLGAVAGVVFVSLQKGRAGQQDRPPGLTLHDWTDELDDMAQTAALVTALDLVISVDTAVAHLAGALGRPVWLLNRFDSDWRWGLDRSDSPWYPSMRIFRQAAPGDWAAPVAAISDTLATWNAASAVPVPAANAAAPLPAGQWQRAGSLDRLASHALTKGDFEAALALSQSALQLEPESPWLHNNLANAQRALGRLQDALESYRQADRLAPGQASVRCNVAHVLGEMGQRDAAETAYDEAIALDPEFADARVARGALLISDGRLAEGWDDFAWRRRIGTFNRRGLEGPEWDGTPDPKCRVLLHSDEGLGDAIQFCRYVPMVAERVRVVLEAPKELAPLFRGLPGPIRHVTLGEPPGEFDTHLPLLDLGRIFKSSLQSVPNQVPYLHADPARVADWRDRLAALPGLRVGLVWSGNPANPADRQRSVPQDVLRPLLLQAAARRAGGVSFVSLQKHNDREGIATFAAETGMHDWTDALHDMGDTAALITALDLVLAVDTSVAHLAGALGRPVWLLNRNNTDWRWMRARADSPWYPTMRIFRQPRPGAWDAVIAAVLDALPDHGTGHGG